MADEDKKTLTKSGLEFNINVIIGGKLAGDTIRRLYFLYPQVNWIEVG